MVVRPEEEIKRLIEYQTLSDKDRREIFNYISYLEDRLKEQK